MGWGEEMDIKEIAQKGLQALVTKLWDIALGAREHLDSTQRLTFLKL